MRVRILLRAGEGMPRVRSNTSAYASAYVGIRVSIRQHTRQQTSACVNIRQHTCWRRDAACPHTCPHTATHVSAYVSAYCYIRVCILPAGEGMPRKKKKKKADATATCVRIRVRMLLYVSAYVSAYYDLRAKGCEKRKRTSLRTAIVCSTFLYRSASTFVPVKQVLLYQ